MVTVGEMKQYLRIDFSEDDGLLGILISSAEELCASVARIPLEEYGSKLKLCDNKIMVSDLYDYYLHDDVIHAIEILKRTVSGYFHVELIFY